VRGPRGAIDRSVGFLQLVGSYRDIWVIAFGWPVSAGSPQSASGRNRRRPSGTTDSGERQSPVKTTAACLDSLAFFVRGKWRGCNFFFFWGGGVFTPNYAETGVTGVFKKNVPFTSVQAR